MSQGGRRARPGKRSPTGAHARRVHAPAKVMYPDEDRRRDAYLEVGRRYATPPPPDALPQPEATLRELRRVEAERRGFGAPWPANASERYKARTVPWEARGCTYQGKNTSDGRCPKCKRRAHGQRR